MSAIKFSFSKKQKILLLVGVPLALVINYFVSNAQEVDRLTAQLERGSPELQMEAIDKLAQMGSSADGALDALALASRDSDATLRSAAIRAIVIIDRREAIEILEQAFDSRDMGVRMDAAEALSRMGSKKAQAILSRSEAHAQNSYERAQMQGWAKGLRREYEQKKKKKYRRHKKIYGD